MAVIELIESQKKRLLKQRIGKVKDVINQYTRVHPADLIRAVGL
jgi:hypothetical protein